MALGLAAKPAAKKVKKAEDVCCDTAEGIVPRDVCPICFCECGDAPMTVITTPCGHKYHTMCFKRYMDHSKGKKFDCALCRHPFSWRSLMKPLEAGEARTERFVEDMVLVGMTDARAMVSSTVTRSQYRILPTSIAAGMALPRAFQFLRSKGAKVDPAEATMAFCHQIVARNRDKDEAAMLEIARDLPDLDLDQYCEGVARRKTAKMGYHPRLFGLLAGRGGDRMKLATQAARCENARALAYALGGQNSIEALRALVDSAASSKSIGVLLAMGWSKDQWKEVARAKLEQGGELRFVTVLEVLAQDGCL